MKRPNGYGSIINLGKGRRRPWAVRITDPVASASSSQNGQRQQKYKYIGYYKTKAEAYSALDAYNSDKPTMEYIGITFSEIWEKWADRNLDTGSASRKKSYTAAYNKCSPLFNKSIQTIRLADLQEIFDNFQGQSISTLNNIKIVMNYIFDWAIKNDIIDKNYSDFVEINAKKTKNHFPITHQQFDEIYSQPEKTDIQKLILIYIFTGCRPAELFNLKISDIHIAEQYFYIREAKTSAGVRLVPIADKILPFFKYFYSQGINSIFKNYKQYYNEFVKIYPDHTPHDTRSTFISYLIEKDVPLTIIQKIVGHKSGNVTIDVYTKLSFQPLLDAVNKL